MRLHPFTTGSLSGPDSQWSASGADCGSSRDEQQDADRDGDQTQSDTNPGEHLIVSRVLKQPPDPAEPDTEPSQRDRQRHEQASERDERECQPDDAENKARIAKPILGPCCT